MADLALIHVADKYVESLTQSEYRRLAIGTQLVIPFPLKPISLTNLVAFSSEILS